MKRFLTLLGSVLLISGCSHLGVEPWQRERLADPRMTMEANAIDKGFDDHIYFSKEASSGGRGTAGGGCGCN
ncbi:DUF4266 domain-containing protein [Ferrimonas pelagia]|uniref:DUF4266 domain-containing protein n=1 Tax=Ferrimonas pelagia TaxID=1177826 RepID=A0ABP9FDJ6_9GAMM